MKKDTFSEMLKEELSRVKTEEHSQAFWEAYALRRFLATKNEKRFCTNDPEGNGKTVISAKPFLLRRLFYLEKHILGSNLSFRAQRKRQTQRTPHGEILIDGNSIPVEPSLKVLLGNTSCRRSYLRGVFLAKGSVSSPNRAHHLEMVLPCKEEARWVQAFMEKEGLKAGLVSRRSTWVVYLKGSEQICEFLKILGSSRSVLEYENIRAKKNLKSSVQRLVNMDKANVSRAVEASFKQIEDILSIEREKGLSCLSPALKDLARMRLEHPELSMEELGQLLNPPISKSAVNHRFRRIARIASNLHTRV